MTLGVLAALTTISSSAGPAEIKEFIELKLKGKGIAFSALPLAVQEVLQQLSLESA